LSVPPREAGTNHGDARLATGGVKDYRDRLRLRAGLWSASAGSSPDLRPTVASTQIRKHKVCVHLFVPSSATNSCWSNTSATDDAGTWNGRSASEDDPGRRRESLPVKSCAYLIVEIARDDVQRVILAPAGDATPRVEEAPATRDLHMGDPEESPVADHELARGVDQGLRSFHASDLRCAIDSTHHAR